MLTISLAAEEMIIVVGGGISVRNVSGLVGTVIVLAGGGVVVASPGVVVSVVEVTCSIGPCMRTRHAS